MVEDQYSRDTVLVGFERILREEHRCPKAGSQVWYKPP